MDTCNNIGESHKYMQHDISLTPKSRFFIIVLKGKSRRGQIKIWWKQFRRVVAFRVGVEIAEW